MTVYFARAVRGNQLLIKIGVSGDVKARMSTIGASSPTPIVLLAAIEGGRETERLIHEQLKSSRVSGEWFKPTEEVMEMIKNAKLAATPTAQRSAVENPIFHDAPIEDLRIVTSLLGRAMGPLGGRKTKSMALQELLPRLREINPLWSLRKLKSIQNQESTCVQLWVYRDLVALLENTDETFFGPEIDELGRVMGGMDRSRVEGG